MPRAKRCSDWGLTTNVKHIQRLENDLIKMSKKLPDKAKTSLRNEECFNDLLQGKLPPISFKVDDKLPNQDTCLVFIPKLPQFLFLPLKVLNFTKMEQIFETFLFQIFQKKNLQTDYTSEKYN